MKEYIAEYIVPVVPADEKDKNIKFDFMNAKRLIQCKDCKFWRNSYFESVIGMVCHKTRYIMKPDDYCSMARAKEIDNAEKC